MKNLFVNLIKLVLWIVAFPIMLVYSLFKEKKLLITILCIVFFPIAIMVAVLLYLVRGK